MVTLFAFILFCYFTTSCMQLDISNCILYIDILSLAMHLGVDYETHFAGHSLFIIQIHLINEKKEVYCFPGWEYVEANSTISLTRLHYQYVTRDITCRSFHTYLIDKKP